MAGEYQVAQKVVEQAMEEASASTKMSEDAMCLALFSELIGRMAKTNSKQQLTDLLHFQLESLGNDEHVITRGC